MHSLVRGQAGNDESMDNFLEWSVGSDLDLDSDY